MPRRTDINKILIIGSGPIVIGQACEFDYSGTQACKALKEEGFEVVLVNSNPATIMTDPEMADRTYIEPITPEIVEKIIERERPDALLPTLGGQTGLNVALTARGERRAGELQGEDDRRQLRGHHARRKTASFSRRPCRSIGLDLPQSGLAYTMDGSAAQSPQELGFPLIIRPSFTLGGTGGGIAYTMEEFEGIAAAGPAEQHDQRNSDRGIGDRLEGIRARGHARSARTTWSSSAPLRTSIPWASIPATPSPWRRHRP